MFCYPLRRIIANCSFPNAVSFRFITCNVISQPRTHVMQTEHMAATNNTAKNASGNGYGPTAVWPKAVLFGDSITQYSFTHDGCWGSLLSEHLQRKCDVVNRGFSGYNTRWCVRIISKVFQEFPAEHISMVTIFLGANDSNLPSNTHQHVPSSEFKEHLVAMVGKLQAHGVPREKIVLITTPACDEERWRADCIKKNRLHLFHKCNEAAGKFAKVTVEAARECGTLCVDLYTEMMKQKDWESLLNDGLHLSNAGSKLLFSLLRPVVDKLTSDLVELYPNWKDIDNKNLDASFS